MYLTGTRGAVSFFAEVNLLQISDIDPVHRHLPASQRPKFQSRQSVFQVSYLSLTVQMFLGDFCSDREGQRRDEGCGRSGQFRCYLSTPRVACCPDRSRPLGALFAGLSQRRPGDPVGAHLRERPSAGDAVHLRDSDTDAAPCRTRADLAAFQTRQGPLYSTYSRLLPCSLVPEKRTMCNFDFIIRQNRA